MKLWTLCRFLQKKLALLPVLHRIQTLTFLHKYMKKLLITVLGLGVLFSAGTTFAYRPDKVRDPLNPISQVKAERSIQDAIWHRWKNLFTKRRKGRDYEDIKKQKIQHTSNLKKASVSKRSTIVDRTGPLEEDDGIRGMTKTVFERPTAKGAWRARALDYYVDGGVAGVESMKAGVIYGSEHVVPRVILRTKTEEVGAIIKKVRQEGKNFLPESPDRERIPSTPFRKGDARRNFLHPYMPAFDFEDDFGLGNSTFAE